MIKLRIFGFQRSKMRDNILQTCNTQMMSNAFHLGDALDISRLKAAFGDSGRVEIRNFLRREDADGLRTHLVERSDWKLVINADDTVYEIPRSGVQQFTEQQRRELDNRIAKSARHGFQYSYETIRALDGDTQRQGAGSLLDGFVRFMSSEAVLSVLGEITGVRDLHFADGQATAYSPGHFLTRHDDDVEGKHRRAAYVLGLTPVWRSEWGGLLMFHRSDDNIDEAFVPAMGALRLFSVPTPHSVSYVAPFAPEPRISVTGWLRARAPAS